MAKARAEVTVYQSKSVSAVYRYYLLATTKPRQANNLSSSNNMGINRADLH